MPWITESAEQPLNLDQEREDAGALEQVRTLLAARPLPDGTDNVIALLEKIEAGRKPPGLEDIPEALIERLIAWYPKALENNRDAQKLRALLLPLGELCGGDGQALGALTWPLDTAGGGKAGSISLKVPLQAAIRLSPCAALPQGAGTPPVGQRTLLIGVQGQVQVAADTDLPVGRFTLSPSASGNARMGCDFYSLHDASNRLAPAVAAGFGRLATSPFDLAAMAERLQRHELQCISLSLGAGVSLGGRIALAGGPVLMGPAGLKLTELAYGFNAALDGAVDLLVQGDPEQPGKVRLNLSRRDAVNRSGRASIRVGLDLDSVYLRLKSELRPLLQSAGNILDRVEPWLAPGTLIRKRLKAQIPRLDANTEALLGPALETPLGFDPKRKAVDGLVQLLAERIATLGLDLETQGQQRGNPLLGEVLGRLGLPPGLDADLRGRLAGKVDKALADLRGRVTEAIEQAAAGPAVDRLDAALMEIGERPTGPADDPNARPTRVRVLLRRYRARIGELYTAMEGVTKAKLEARLSLSASHGDRREADLSLRLDPALASAQQAYREAMLGSFDALSRLVDDPASGVEMLDCRLSRLVQDRKASKLDVSLLGFALGGASVLDRQTRIDTDMAGNVTVLSKGEYQSRRELGDESKTIRVAEALALATASRTLRLDVSATLSYRDQHLEPTEVQSFFSSLVAAGLMTAGVVERATDLLDEFHRSNPDCNDQGRLDVGMQLDPAQLQRLLGIGSDAATHGTRVEQVAAQEMAAAYVATNGGDEQRILAALPGSARSTLVETIREGLGGAIGDTSDPVGWNHTLRVDLMHDLCVGLAAALGKMRALYQTPVEQMAGWSNQDFQNRQRDILVYLHQATPGDFPNLWGSEQVRPRTLALFRILARLCGRIGPSARPGDAMSATMTLCGREQRVWRMA